MLAKYRHTLSLLFLFFVLLLCFSSAKITFASSAVGSFEALQPIKQDATIIDSVIVADEYIFVLTHDSKLYYYSISKNKWMEASNLPIKQPNALAVMDEQSIMILGGKTDSGYNENAVYNIATNAFTTLAPFPNHIENIPILNTVTLKNNNVLVIGSYSLYGKKQPIIYEYDSVNKEWIVPYKANYTAFALEQNSDGNVLNYGAGLDESFATGLLFNMNENKYVETASVPSILNFPATAALNHQFLLASGNLSVGGKIIPSNQAYMYDSTANTWQSIAHLKTARVFAKAVGLSEQYALVIGGFNNGGLKSTELYDAMQNKWVIGPTLHYSYEQPEAHLTTTGKLYVLGSTIINDETVINIETMNISQSYLTSKNEPKPSIQESKFDGILMKQENLFQEAEWSYNIQYRYVEHSTAVFSNEHFQYTRMYLVRQHLKTGKAETLLEGNFSFLRKDGNQLYLIESGQLKRLTIGAVFSEPVTYPHTFTKEDSTDSRYNMFGHWSLHAGKPIRVSSYHFDGEYIYTWWNSGQYKGFPIKIHYTGQSLRILGTQLATDLYSQLLLDGNNLYYTTGEVQGQPSQIIWSTTDGKIEQKLAEHKGGISIAFNRIYYRDAHDNVKDGFSAGKLYSMNLDGTNKIKLDDNGAGLLYPTKHGLVYSTYTGDSIKLINNNSIDAIIPNKPHVFYTIHEVNDYFMCYSSLNSLTSEIIGSYKYSFTTKQSTAFKISKQSISTLLNGNKLAFPQPPILKNGSVMVPFRVILEELGTQVVYDAQAKAVTATKEATTVVINQNKVIVNGSERKLAQAPFIQNGTTYVPLRFMSEIFGANVYWLGELQQVVIHMN